LPLNLHDFGIFLFIFFLLLATFFGRNVPFLKKGCVAPRPFLFLHYVAWIIFVQSGDAAKDWVELKNKTSFFFDICSEISKIYQLFGGLQFLTVDSLVIFRLILRSETFEYQVLPSAMVKIGGIHFCCHNDSSLCLFRSKCHQLLSRPLAQSSFFLLLTKCLLCPNNVTSIRLVLESWQIGSSDSKQRHCQQSLRIDKQIVEKEKPTVFFPPGDSFDEKQPNFFVRRFVQSHLLRVRSTLNIIEPTFT
jgi:hypothetical protein